MWFASMLRYSPSWHRAQAKNAANAKAEMTGIFAIISLPQCWKFMEVQSDGYLCQLRVSLRCRFKATFLAITFDNMVHLREDQQLVEPTWDGELVTILAGQPFENSGMSQDVSSILCIWCLSTFLFSKLLSVSGDIAAA
jgi:hypothetical protein